MYLKSTFLPLLRTGLEIYFWAILGPVSMFFTINDKLSVMIISIDLAKLGGFKIQILSSPFLIFHSILPEILLSEFRGQMFSSKSLCARERFERCLRDAVSSQHNFQMGIGSEGISIYKATIAIIPKHYRSIKPKLIRFSSRTLSRRD